MASEHPRRPRSQDRRGFTFLEMMIVVSIIGVLTALAIGGWQRAGVKRDIHGAIGQIESAVRTARNLAALAGGHIGTPTFNNCAVVNGAPASLPAGTDTTHLSILINGPDKQVVAPILLQDDGLGGLETVCTTIDLNGFNSDGRTAELLAGTLDTTALTLAFSQLGRPYIPPGAPIIIPQRWNVGIRTDTGEATLEEGFQILPSGVLCRRKIGGLPMGAGITCDES